MTGNKGSWENGTNRLAWCRVTTIFQLVCQKENAVSTKYNQMYACTWSALYSLTFRFCDRLESGGKAFLMLLELCSFIWVPDAQESRSVATKNPSLSLAPLSIRKPLCFSFHSQGFSYGTKGYNHQPLLLERTPLLYRLLTAQLIGLLNFLSGDSIGNSGNWLEVGWGLWRCSGSLRKNRYEAGS